MRSIFTLALVAILSTITFGAALAQTVPLDPNPSTSQVWGYAQRIGGEVKDLERSLAALKGRIPSHLVSRLTAVEEGLLELREAAKAPGAAPADLEARIAALEAATAALPTDADLDAWKAQFEASAAEWRAEIELRIATLESGAAQARTDISALRRDVEALKRNRARLVSFQLGAGYRFFSVPGPITEGYDRRSLHLAVARGSVGFDLARYSAKRISLVRINGEGGGGSMQAFTAGIGVDWCAGRNWTGASLSFCGGASYRRTDARAGQIEHPSWSSSTIAATLAPRVDVGRWWLEAALEPGVGHLKAWGANGDTQSGWGFTLGAGLVTGARF